MASTQTSEADVTALTEQGWVPEFPQSSTATTQHWHSAALRVNIERPAQRWLRSPAATSSNLFVHVKHDLGSSSLGKTKKLFIDHHLLSKYFATDWHKLARSSLFSKYSFLQNTNVLLQNTTEKTIKMAAKTIGLSHDCSHFKISVTKGRGGTNIFSRDTTWAYLVHAVQAWRVANFRAWLQHNIRNKCDGDLGTPLQKRKQQNVACCFDV